MDEVKRPPLGVMPRAQWEEVCAKKRLTMIKDAIVRYFEEDKEIPEIWIQEHNELVAKIAKRK